jgi:hypothetical protein
LLFIAVFRQLTLAIAFQQQSTCFSSIKNSVIILLFIYEYIEQ